MKVESERFVGGKDKVHSVGAYSPKGPELEAACLACLGEYE